MANKIKTNERPGNRPPSDIELAVCRQAFSLGIIPDSDEFDKMMMARLWPGKPISAIEHHLIRMSEVMRRMTYLSSFFKWCKRNEGLCVHDASAILGLSPCGIIGAGEECVIYYASQFDPVKRYLTGNDRHTLYASVGGGPEFGASWSRTSAGILEDFSHGEQDAKEETSIVQDLH